MPQPHRAYAAAAAPRRSVALGLRIGADAAQMGACDCVAQEVNRFRPSRR
jgi:hypothetical protein